MRCFQVDKAGSGSGVARLAKIGAGREHDGTPRPACSKPGLSEVNCEIHTEYSLMKRQVSSNYAKQTRGELRCLLRAPSLAACPGCRITYGRVRLLRR